MIFISFAFREISAKVEEAKKVYLVIAFCAVKPIALSLNRIVQTRETANELLLSS